MTSAHHPSYENPTIQEAICDIQFQLPDGVSWDPAWYSGFHRHIQDQFPTFQPVSLPIFVEVSGRPRGSNIFGIPQAIRFHHASRSLLLQLFEGRIVVSVLGDYPGWAQVREDIQQAWDAVREVIQPAHINRLALRYINRVERGGTNETADKWFRPSDFVQPAILRSLPPFVMRVETRPDNVNRTNVTFGHQELESSAFGAFILDIDRVSEAELRADTDLLLEEADRLHDDVWLVFQSTKGERLEQLLQGEIP